MSMKNLAGVVLPILALFGVALATAYWIGTLGHAWYVQPLAALAFALVMASAVPALLRGDKTQRDSIVPRPATPQA
jgi:membrane protein implicated in regulation of membrane protease activity